MLTPRQRLRCAVTTLPLAQKLCMKISWVDGSLTMQDLLWMMIGATVGLLGLKLCTKWGLLPPAALPLTQGCHVERLQTKDEGGSD